MYNNVLGGSVLQLKIRGTSVVYYDQVNEVDFCCNHNTGQGTAIDIFLYPSNSLNTSVHCNYNTRAW